MKKLKVAKVALIKFGAFVLMCSISVTSNAIAEEQATEQSIKKAKDMRIIALAPHIVEMLFDIGVGDKIVGAVEYSDHPEAALDIPRVGGYHGMKIEKILELQPDLVIAWQSGNQVADIEKMQKLGLKVVFSNPSDIGDVAKELRYFGSLTSSEIAAEKAATQYESDLTAIREKHKNSKPVPVFYQLWPEPMMTINKETWINQLIEICQGQNVFGNNPTAYPKIGIENVIVAQPEVIVMPNERSDKEQLVIDWSKWPEIPAVKNNRFVRVNADLLHRFSTRMLKGVEDLCTKIDAVR